MSCLAGTRIIRILLVEDDPADQKLVKAAFSRAKIPNDLSITSSGEEALDFLGRKGRYGPETPRPDIILMDLNMPGMGGMEFLRRVKQEPRLSTIPIVVLTSSEAEEDIQATYQHHVNAYVTKPVGLNEFDKVIERLEGFWFTVCKLPKSA